MEYPKFTKAMKETHTILLSDMLPIHFRLISFILEDAGYHVECLHNASRSVVDEGLKNVHNDTCYPALLVIGQFLDALNSGKYDVNHVALLITQTGGGCRASNYIHLLRKAMAVHYPQVPVISFNFSGLEKDKESGFHLSLSDLLHILYAAYYGDLLMSLYNQVLPYEVCEGEAKETLERWENKLKKILVSSRCFRLKKYAGKMIDDFNRIPLRAEKKIKVGIVGEIYVKYSPLANNHLEDFLRSEGCEAIVPALMDFVLYSVDATLYNHKTYRTKNKFAFLFRIAYRYMYGMEKKLNRLIEKRSKFEIFHDFEKLKQAANRYISEGVVMGEGWLIPAEMALLVESGCENIVACQPFGCLPNHIVSKGMQRVIKKAYPEANIVAIDYDPGATQVNQENRIKLMLSQAKEKQKEGERKSD